jgi:hypothetical protein
MIAASIEGWIRPDSLQGNSNAIQAQFALDTNRNRWHTR